MRLDTMPISCQPRVRQLICHVYCMVNDFFASYKKELDIKAISTLQELLISLGFPKTGAFVLETWTEEVAKAQSESSAVVDAAPVAKEGDDKRKGKKADL